MLLGSASLDDLLDRVDTVNRVRDQDARVINEVRTFRAEIKEREAKLTMARAEQERLVAERAAKRDQIRSQLAERQQLLSSIKDQIAKIQAAERAQQQRLANQAETRISNDSGGNPTGHYGGVVGVAMQYLGSPIPVGRGIAERLRLLRLRDVRLLAGGRLAPAQRRPAVQLGEPVSRESSRPATSSSSTGSATSASTSAAASSSTRRTRATW